jgi:Lon protease-like protein
MSSERIIPIFPLNVVLLPTMDLPLHIFEERYKVMIGQCLKGSGEFGIVYHDGTSIMDVGCVARITKVLKRYDDGRMDIVTTGSWRFRIEELIDSKPYFEARVVQIDDQTDSSDSELIELAREGTRELEKLRRLIGQRIDLGRISRMEIVDFSFIMAASDLFSAREKQRYLEMTDTGIRIRQSIDSLRNIVWRLHMKRELKRLFGTRTNPSETTNN